MRPIPYHIRNVVARYIKSDFYDRTKLIILRAPYSGSSYLRELGISLTPFFPVEHISLAEYIEILGEKKVRDSITLMFYRYPTVAVQTFFYMARYRDNIPKYGHDAYTYFKENPKKLRGCTGLLRKMYIKDFTISHSIPYEYYDYGLDLIKNYVKQPLPSAVVNCNRPIGVKHTYDYASNELDEMLRNEIPHLFDRYDKVWDTFTNNLPKEEVRIKEFDRRKKNV